VNDEVCIALFTGSATVLTAQSACDVHYGMPLMVPTTQAQNDALGAALTARGMLPFRA